MKLLILRPQPGADATAKRAAEGGFESIIMPLFEIIAVPWAVPEARQYDAMLLTSTHAAAHAGPGLEPLMKLPVFAVGGATAAAARERGLEVAQTGTGGVADILEKADTSGIGHLLWLAGADRTAIEPPDGMCIDPVTVYEASIAAPPANFCNILDEADVVLLHSSRAAAAFAQMCDRSGVDRAQHELALLSPNVAEAAGSGWGAIAIAKMPDDASLLSAAASFFR